MVPTKASFRSIATQLANEPNSRPSDFVSRDEAQEVAQRVLDKRRSRVDGWFNLCIHDERGYPERLCEAEHPRLSCFITKAGGNWLTRGPLSLSDHAGRAMKAFEEYAAS